MLATRASSTPVSSATRSRRGVARDSSDSVGLPHPWKYVSDAGLDHHCDRCHRGVGLCTAITSGCPGNDGSRPRYQRRGRPSARNGPEAHRRVTRRTGDGRERDRGNSRGENEDRATGTCSRLRVRRGRGRRQAFPVGRDGRAGRPGRSLRPPTAMPVGRAMAACGAGPAFTPGPEMVARPGCGPQAGDAGALVAMPVMVAPWVLAADLRTRGDGGRPRSWPCCAGSEVPCGTSEDRCSSRSAAPRRRGIHRGRRRVVSPERPGTRSGETTDGAEAVVVLV